MPLNKKGKKIKKAMVKQYGKKKGNAVFYAMENSGKIKGVKKKTTSNKLKNFSIRFSNRLVGRYCGRFDLG